MRIKRDLITIRIEPAIQRRFLKHCVNRETTMSQVLRRYIKQELGIVKQEPPRDAK